MKKILHLLLVLVIFFGCKTDNTTQPEKDTTPPTVSITSPVNNGSVVDSALIVVDASDNIAVEKVEIYIDGNLVFTRSTVPWQYYWNVRNLSPNTVHTIVAKAYDAANNIGTSQTISVTVNLTDTTPPSVSITSPTNNSNVIDSTLIIVNASDNVGVKKVEFYIDGILSSTISTVPWQYNWDVRALSPNSTHTILAKAYDAANNIGNSGTITVTVHITNDVNTVAVYHFDETNGSIVSDASVYGNNGTATGTTIVTGKFGKARSFNGTSDKIYIGNPSSIASSQTAITVEAWVCPENVGQSAGHIISAGNQNRFVILADTGNWFTGCIIKMVDAVNGVGVSIRAKNTFTPNTWYHVALTFDGNIEKLFINGSLDNSISLTGTMYTPQNNMITFGAYTWSGGTNEYYKGIIDEVRISNIARTPSDFDLNK